MRLWICVVALVVLAAAWVSSGAAAASLSWNERVHWATAERDLLLKQGGCPPLEREAEPGAAWSLYAMAGRRAAACGRVDAVLEALEASVVVPGERAAAQCAAVAPALALLRRGARCAVDIDRASGVLPGTTLLDVGGILDVGAVALWTFEERLRRGDGAAAVSLVSDSIAVGVDLMRLGTLVEATVGALMVRRVLDRVTDAACQSLDASLQQELLEKLTCIGCLDLLAVDLDRREVALGVLACDGDPDCVPGADGLHSALAAWQYGFSPQRRAQHALLQKYDLLMARGGLARAWTARRAQIDALAATAVDDPVVSHGERASPYEFDRSLREAVLRLHQVRLLLAFLRHEALPELADPLGDTPLKAVVEGNTLVVHAAVAGFTRRVVRPAD